MTRRFGTSIAIVHWKIDFLGDNADRKLISIEGWKMGLLTKNDLFCQCMSLVVLGGGLSCTLRKIGWFGMKVVHTGSKPVLMHSPFNGVFLRDSWRWVPGHCCMVPSCVYDAIARDRLSLRPCHRWRVERWWLPNSFNGHDLYAKAKADSTVRWTSSRWGTSHR